MKAGARIVAVLGAALVAWLLYRAAPRDVTLVYDVSRAQGATGLSVRIQRGDRWIRSADFELPTPGGQVRQEVKLRDGAYVVQYGLYAPAGTSRGERELQVTESGVIVLPLGP